jgi:hypothetical protein
VNAGAPDGLLRNKVLRSQLQSILSLYVASFIYI